MVFLWVLWGQLLCPPYSPLASFTATKGRLPQKCQYIYTVPRERTRTNGMEGAVDMDNASFSQEPLGSVPRVLLTSA